MASLSRRSLLAAAPTLVLAACGEKMRTTASTTPRLDIKGLNKDVEAIAARARPGLLGVGLMNLESGEVFVREADRRFPMQSVFKLPLACAVMAEVDGGRMKLDELVVLTEEQLSSQYSPIAAAWPARHDYTTGQLLDALLVESDNTAADVLMKRIGGPGVVTAWLTGKRLTGIRVDRYERELVSDIYGMSSFRPSWRTGSAFAAAVASVPPAQRLAAFRAYMADPRDTATPGAMLDFLQMLDRGDLVSPAATRLIVERMAATTRGNTRLRAGLPKDAFLAHRPGTSGVEQGISAAHNDVGIFRLADKRAYAIAAFLSGSTLDEAGRDAVIADVARAAVRGVR